MQNATSRKLVGREKKKGKADVRGGEKKMSEKQGEGVGKKQQQHENKQPSGWQPQAGDSEGTKKLWRGEKSRRSKNIERRG